MQGGKDMEQFPTDLMVEIFSRLPSKSVARFCTLSKHWASILYSQDFAKMFLARSSTRPRLLFAVEQYGYNRWQFFSTPQPQSRYEKSSHVDFHSKFSGDVSRYICSYASGLFCFPRVKIFDENAHIICNPITGLYVRLPYLERYRDKESRGFLGFDPIARQFKVIKQKQADDHSILTLGTGELSWRRNETTDIRRSLTEGICINGMLYYLALKFGEELSMVAVIVCCDVRSEEFSFINAEWFNVQPDDPLALSFDPTVFALVNYKGKLGGIEWKRTEADGRSTVELCMWVLEDVKKQEWVNYVYILPEHDVLSSCKFSIAGVTPTGDIVLVMKYICEPFYVFYFNPEENTLQSVEIQGFGADFETVGNRGQGQVYAFVDHVEDFGVNNANQLKSNISHITSYCPCCEAKKKKEKEGEEQEVV